MFFTTSRQAIEKNREAYLAMYDKSHLLVQLDQLIDWQSILKKLMRYYSNTNTGRPSKDPIILVKILLIQSLEGFRSVRLTCKQVQSNATYRWFLGIHLFEKVPHHSTISRFLWERLKGPPFWLALFNEQVRAIHQEGFIANKTWAADETELKANANKRFRQRLLVKKRVEENENDLKRINQFREKQGKKPLKSALSKVIFHPTNFSPVDEDARLSVKHVERGQFAYYEHRIVDTLHGFIIASEITAANRPGHQLLPQQLNQLHQLFQQYAKEITLDAGYYNAQCANELFKRGFFVSIPYKRSQTKEHPSCRRHQFKKLNETTYACPMGVPFRYTTSTRKGYHEFKASKGSCKNCPFALNEKDRILRLSIHQKTYDRLREMRLSWKGKILKTVRPQTIELSFAHSKEYHGLRYARYRGMPKVKTQVLMIALIQNFKKWTKLRSLKQVGLHLTYKIIEDSFE